jgi:hypothetical protein
MHFAGTGNSAGEMPRFFAALRMPIEARGGVRLRFGGCNLDKADESRRPFIYDLLLDSRIHGDCHEWLDGAASPCAARQISRCVLLADRRPEMVPNFPTLHGIASTAVCSILDGEVVAVDFPKDRHIELADYTGTATLSTISRKI